MYHTPNNNDLEEYIEIYNQGTTTVNMGGWHFIDGINFTFPSDQTIGAQQYLVVAADVPTFQAKYPGITNVRGGWTGKLSDKGEKITLVDQIGIVMDEVLYADEGDWAQRELGPVDYGHRGWIWSEEHDGGGKSLELMNPAMPNQYGQNWTAGLTYNGTPCNANSITSNDIAPIISDVKHQPMIPHSDEQVTVTAQVIDEQATGITVTLNYRVDGAASFSSKPMGDNGLNGDDDAGDGIYGATIDAMPDGTIMEFFIAAGDTTGHDRLYPASSMVDSVPQQVTNILYIVDNSFDPVWVPGSKPIYYIIMTAAERAKLEEIGDADSDPFTGEGRSDQP
jgi:hypothetical protein